MSPFIGFCDNLAEHPPLINDFAFAWLEGVMQAKLCRFSEAQDWQDWPAGRLFGEQGEYRWQRNAAGQIHAVLLMDSGEPPDWFAKPKPPCLLEESEEIQFILWGEQDDTLRPEESGSAVFYAPELPIPQVYPLDPQERKGARACLIIRRYRSTKEQEQGEFERCVAVRRYFKEGHGEY